MSTGPTTEVSADFLGALAGLGARLAGATAESDVLESIVHDGSALTGAAAVVVGLVADDAVQIAAHAGYPPGYLDPWSTFPRDPGTPMTDAIATEKAVYCTSREERDETWPVFRGTGASGSEAFVVLPLRARLGVIGALTLSFSRIRAFDTEERTFLESFASFCGLALERTRFFEERERAHAAERLARQRTERLQRFTERLAPALAVADVAAIACNKALVASGGATTLIALEQRGLLEVRSVEGFPTPDAAAIRSFSRDDPSVIGEVFRTREPLWLSTREAWERFEEAVGRPPVLRSVAILPVAASGAFFGVLGIAFDHERSFPADERAFLMAIAGQTAQALDRARLHEEQSEIARILQESLLPRELPKVPGCEVAARYHAAGAANEAGGDFYDLFAAGEGHVLVIGDVCGKGAEAAAVTALCRHTLRAGAFQQASIEPASLLALLNRAVLEHGSDGIEFASAMCGLLTVTPHGVSVVLAGAGHPPALLRRAGGVIEECGPQGPMVGLFEGAQFSEVTLTLKPGDLLVLLTDGLTDARTANGSRVGERLVHETLSSLTRPEPAEAVRAFDRLLARAEIVDDVAVVAVAPSRR